MKNINTKAMKLLPPWKTQSLPERAEMCRVLLSLHGFISETENKNVKRRIKKYTDDKHAKQKEEN